MTIPSAGDFRKADRLASRSADRINAEIEQLISRLPPWVAIDYAIQGVILDLAILQPGIVSMILNDPIIRARYDKIVAMQERKARLRHLN